MGTMPLTRIRSKQSQTIKILLAFAAVYIIWGTTYLAIRVAVETLPPFLMAGARFLAAGLAALAFLRARRVPWPTWPQWRAAAVVGAFLLVGGNGLVTWAEMEVPSGAAALIVATMPLWMALFDWLAFRGGRPALRTIFGLLLGLFGIALLIGPDLVRGTAGIGLLSWLLLFLAPILWSLGSLYSRRANLPENVFMATAVEMLTGGAMLMVAAFLIGEWRTFEAAAVSSDSLVAALYLTVMGSIVALTAYVWLIKNVPIARIATYTYVNPVIAVFLGWLILHEAVTGQMLVATAVIIGAVILITVHRPRQEPQKELDHGNQRPGALSLSPWRAPSEPVRLAVRSTSLEEADAAGTARGIGGAGAPAGARCGD